MEGTDGVSRFCRLRHGEQDEGKEERAEGGKVGQGKSRRGGSGREGDVAAHVGRGIYEEGG